MLEESTGNFSATRNIYDWYQTTTHVILNVMIKNLKESDVKVKLIDETLDVTCSLADGSQFKLHFNLFKSIYVSESNWTVSPSKLEIKLKKTDRKRWQSLEVLPDKSGKRPISFVGFVQSNAAKKANTTVTKVNTSMSETFTGNSTTSPKYDWFQSTTNVNITIHIPNLNEDDVKVDFTENSLFWFCKLPDGTVYNVNLSLFRPINVSLSSWSLTVSKLEICLHKKDSVRWTNLEAASQTIRSTNLSTAFHRTLTTAFIAEPQASGSALNNHEDNDGINENNNDIDNNNVNLNDNIDLKDDDYADDCSANSSDLIANHDKGFDYTLVSLEPTDIVQHNNNDSHNSDPKVDKDLENLNKIVSDFKEKEKLIEEKEANTTDGNVDELIREIYEKGGEEVRRAMNKRFNESGSVLNVEEYKTDEEVKNEIDFNSEDVCEGLDPNLEDTTE